MVTLQTGNVLPFYAIYIIHTASLVYIVVNNVFFFLHISTSIDLLFLASCFLNVFSLFLHSLFFTAVTVQISPLRD